MEAHLLHTVLKLLARPIRLTVQLERDPSKRTTRHLFHFHKQLLHAIRHSLVTRYKLEYHLFLVFSLEQIFEPLKLPIISR